MLTWNLGRGGSSLPPLGNGNRAGRWTQEIFKNPYVAFQLSLDPLVLGPGAIGFDFSGNRSVYQARAASS